MAQHAAPSHRAPEGAKAASKEASSEAERQEGEERRARPEAEDAEGRGDRPRRSRAEADRDRDEEPRRPRAATEGARDAQERRERSEAASERAKGKKAAAASRLRLRVAAGVVAVVAVVAIVCGAFAWSGAQGSSQQQMLDSLAMGDDLPQDVLESPVDLKALKLKNPDVYAWLSVPEAAVDEPVMQNPYKDNLYLVYDVNGDSGTGGGIYSQQANAKDFTDPVTVLYGHTFETNDMKFGALHAYEDATFFEENPCFYIYTDDKVLVYEVVSAYVTDNQHILNNHDFDDADEVQAYYDFVLNPEGTSSSNVREGVTLTAGEDTIVQLSTCTRPADDSQRYVVTGKLVAEQELG